MATGQRTRTKAALRLAVLATVTYLAVCGVVAWKKEAIIFPMHGRERAAGKTAPAGYETWWHTMRDGTRVEAWWLPARGASAERPAPAVLVYHGNGELIDDSRDFAELWHALGASVLLVEYRGYGRSEGEPGVAACKGDSLEWFDRVTARPEVRRDLVLAHGFSLGGVFAAELAAERPVAGLALEGTVASLREAAHDRFIWILFTRENFDATAVLRRLDPRVPVLLTHGRADEVVPFRHFELLAAARPGARAVADDHRHHPLSTQGRADLLRELLVRTVENMDAHAVDGGAR
jgi:Dipeptidyl aminopeptidases/acylaminoacyl-peptidases